MKKALLVFLFLFSFLNFIVGCSSSSDKCRVDQDCKDGYYCNDGECEKLELELSFEGIFDGDVVTVPKGEAAKVSFKVSVKEIKGTVKDGTSIVLNVNDREYKGSVVQKSASFQDVELSIGQNKLKAYLERSTSITTAEITVTVVNISVDMFYLKGGTGGVKTELSEALVAAADDASAEDSGIQLKLEANTFGLAAGAKVDLYIEQIDLNPIASGTVELSDGNGGQSGKVVFADPITVPSSENVIMKVKSGTFETSVSFKVKLEAGSCSLALNIASNSLFGIADDEDGTTAGFQKNLVVTPTCSGGDCPEDATASIFINDSTEPVEAAYKEGDFEKVITIPETTDANKAKVKVVLSYKNTTGEDITCEAESTDLTVDITAPVVKITEATKPSDPSDVVSGTIEFTASEGTVSCTLKKDEAAAQTVDCSDNSYTYNFTENGRYTFTVTAEDVVKNSGTDTFSWTFEAAVPTAPIVSGSTPTNSDPVWNWTVPTGATAFRYKLSTATEWTVTTDTNTKTYTGTGFEEGTYTLEVQARNSFGTWSVTGEEPNGKLTITVDKTAPTVQITAKPDNPTNVTSGTITFTVSEGTPVCTLAKDGGAATNVACDAASGYAYSLTEDGEYTFTVSSSDVAGNSGSDSYTWTLDTTAPNPPSVSGPEFTNDATPTWSWTSGGNGNGRFRYKLDDPNLETGATETLVLSYTPSSDLDDGKHTLYVQEQDDAGNWSTSGGFEVTIDTEAPDTVILSKNPDVSPTNSRTISFTYEAQSSPGVKESNVTFECRLEKDGSVVVDWTSCNEAGVTYDSSSIDSDSTYEFKVRATDANGNTDSSPAIYSWSVDTVAPETQITLKPSNPSVNTSAKFGFSCTGATTCTFKCQYVEGSGVDPDEAKWEDCTSPKEYVAGTFTDKTTYTFYVKAKDEAGNEDETPELYEWTVDSASFSISLTFDPEDEIVNSNSIVFTFGFVQSGNPTDADSYECTLDGNPIADCNSPYTAGSLSEGSHKFEIDANKGVASAHAEHIWTVDTEAPEVVITRSAPAASPTNEETATFIFTVTDNSATTVVCKLSKGGVDIKTISNCTSPQSFSNPDIQEDNSVGEYTFTVEATDSFGRKTTETDTWTVDKEAPVINFNDPGTILGKGDDTIQTDGNRFTFNVGATFTGCDNNEKTAEVISPSSFGKVTNSGSDGAVSFKDFELNSGIRIVNTIRFECTDNAGNKKTVDGTIVVNTAEPLISFAGSYTNAVFKAGSGPIEFSFNVFNASPNVEIQLMKVNSFSVDGEGKVTSVDSEELIATANVSASPSEWETVKVTPTAAQMPDSCEKYDVIGKFTDPIDNVTRYTRVEGDVNFYDVKKNITVDLIAPTVGDVVIDGLQNGYLNIADDLDAAEGMQTNITVNVSDAGNISDSARTIFLSSSNGDSLPSQANVSDSYLFENVSLADAVHTLTVAVTDCNGNRGEKELTPFTVDTVRPTVAIVDPAGTTAGHDDWLNINDFMKLDVDDVSSLAVGNKITGQTSGAKGKITQISGNQIFVDMSSTTLFTTENLSVDGSDPLINKTITAAVASVVSGEIQNARLNITFGENLNNNPVTINDVVTTYSDTAERTDPYPGVTATNNTATVLLNNLDDFKHTITVSVLDAAGNEGSASKTYEVDPVAATATITAPADEDVLNLDVNAGTPGFQFNISATLTDVSVQKPANVVVKAIPISAINGDPTGGDAVTVCTANGFATASYSCEATGAGAGFWRIEFTVTDSHGNVAKSSTVDVQIQTTEPAVAIKKARNCSSGCTLPSDGGWFKLAEGSDGAGTFTTDITIDSDAPSAPCTLRLGGAAGTVLGTGTTDVNGDCTFTNVGIVSNEAANTLYALVEGTTNGEFTATNVKVDNTLPVAAIVHSTLYQGAGKDEIAIGFGDSQTLTLNITGATAGDVSVSSDNTITGTTTSSIAAGTATFGAMTLDDTVSPGQTDHTLTFTITEKQGTTITNTNTYTLFAHIDNAQPVSIPVTVAYIAKTGQAKVDWTAIVGNTDGKVKEYQLKYEKIATCSINATNFESKITPLDLHATKDTTPKAAGQPQSFTFHVSKMEQGTCSNSSIFTKTACEAGGATWTSNGFADIHRIGVTDGGTDITLSGDQYCFAVRAVDSIYASDGHDFNISNKGLVDNVVDGGEMTFTKTRIVDVDTSADTANLRTRLKSVGDINNDGIDDYAIGDVGAGNYDGLLKIFSGADNSTLYSWTDGGAFKGVGQGISSEADFDGDGALDFAYTGYTTEITIFYGKINLTVDDPSGLSVGAEIAGSDSGASGTIDAINGSVVTVKKVSGKFNTSDTFSGTAVQSIAPAGALDTENPVTFALCSNGDGTTGGDGPQRDGFGAAYGSLESADVNGDGLTDLIVSTKNYTYGGKVGAGAAFIYYGKEKADLIANTYSSNSPDIRLGGLNAGDGFGNIVRRVGKLEGAQETIVIDYALSADSELVFGAAYTTGTQGLANVNYETLSGPGVGAALRTSHVDIDGDGYSDLLSGARTSLSIHYGSDSFSRANSESISYSDALHDNETLNQDSRFAMRLSPSMADIDGSGKPEILTSGGTGGIYLYSTDYITPSKTGSQSADYIHPMLYIDYTYLDGDKLPVLLMEYGIVFCNEMTDSRGDCYILNF